MTKRRYAHDRARIEVRGGQTTVYCTCHWDSGPANKLEVALQGFERHQVEAKRAENKRHGWRP